jgi:hypothetical protein
LVLSPASLVFDLSFDPDDGPATSITVDCLEGSADQPDAGAIPRRSSDVPDFAEPLRGCRTKTHLYENRNQHGG